MSNDKIDGYSAAASRLGPFSWLDFPSVRQLQVDQSRCEAGECIVRLTLESDNGPTRRTVTLVAGGVVNLRISSWGGNETRLIGLGCIDISANQWEGLRWQVVDYENDMIHFYCRDLRIDDVEQ
jgi:hypothetical protein